MEDLMRAARWIVGSLVVAALATWVQQVSGAGPAAITLVPLGVYDTPSFDAGAVEIAAYDPATKRAFMTFAEEPKVGIVNLTDPSNPLPEGDIDLTPWGADAHATSLHVHGGVLAAAVPQGEDETGNGKVLFFDTDGNLLSEVTVGALPDMITFTPDGRMVLTANEGQPNDAYTIDPEGSVSIIDMRGGASALTQAQVTTVGFTAFNAAVLDPSIRIFGPGATVAQDLEPEYITFSNDSKKAWVTLQENNAIAEIDLRRKKITRLMGLGFKDHSQPGRGLDGSRDDKLAEIENWPVLGMYMPDGIASFWSKGQGYLVTANEGDAREYAGLNAPKAADTDEEPVEIEDIVLDPTAFPNAATMQNRTSGIGRLKVTSFQGDTDGDGDYDKLYAFGGRSFSIWTQAGTLVFDSGDAFEQITKDAYPLYFNASSTNNTLDDRSDDKGPEPEGVTVAKLFGRNYAFIMLERIGGVMVYDLTTPANPEFVQYINTRDFAFAPSSAAAGDLGPEAARVVQGKDSPTGKPLLIVSNEVSGSLRIFEIAKVK